MPQRTLSPLPPEPSLLRDLEMLEARLDIDGVSSSRTAPSKSTRTWAAATGPGLDAKQQKQLRGFIDRLVGRDRGSWKSAQVIYGSAAAPLETDVWHGLGEARPGEKLTPSDHVRWASMTKSLSVLYLAWLIDLGRAPRPGDSVGDAVPDFELSKLRVRQDDGKTVAAARPVTWHQVYAMTAPINYEGYLYGGDRDNGFALSPWSARFAKYSRLISHPDEGFYPKEDATVFAGCVNGNRVSRSHRVRAYGRVPLEHQPGARDCSKYGPHFALLGAALREPGVKPLQAFTDRVLRPANVTRLWFDGGQTPKPPGAKLTELAFSYDDGSPPSARDTASCPEDSVTYWASECPGDAMAQCDAARLNTAETAAGDDPYAGVLDIGATGPLTELAKIGRLFLRGGVAEDGTRVVSEAALRIAMQPVGEGESHCDCFKYGSGDAGRKRCEYRMRDFCAGDYWGLGACFKARRPAPPHAPPRVASPSPPARAPRRRRERRRGRRCRPCSRSCTRRASRSSRWRRRRRGRAGWCGAAGARSRTRRIHRPRPAHASPYGAHASRPLHPRYSTHYVLHFESGHYMIAGGGNQPSTHSVPYLPFRYQMLPWFLSAVERGRDGAQLAGMFERDADDEGAARGREMPPP